MKRSWPNLRHYFGVRLNGLRESTKDFDQDIRISGRNLNVGTLKFETGVLTTRPLCSS
jgi:hypothetical protein